MQAFFFLLHVTPNDLTRVWMCAGAMSSSFSISMQSRVSDLQHRLTATGELFVYSEFNHNSPHLHCDNGGGDEGKDTVGGVMMGKKLGERENKGVDKMKTLLE